jgi:hypothetical protein
MSAVIKCDCECHEYPEIVDPVLAKEDGWMVVNGKDICDWCLTGVVCHHWIPRVLRYPGYLETMMMTLYEPALKHQLKAEAEFVKTCKLLLTVPGKAGERVTFSKGRK